MKRVRVFIVTLVGLTMWLGPLRVGAQQVETSWREVDSLVEKQYYRQAFEKAEKQYANALRLQDWHQSLVGAQRLSDIASRYQEDAFDSALVRYQHLMPLLRGVDAAIGRLQLASLYADYYVRHRWQIAQLEALEVESEDFHLWSLRRWQQEVTSLLTTVMEDEALLMGAGGDALAGLTDCSEGADGNLTPTAFDVACEKTLMIVQQLNSVHLTDADLTAPALLYAEAERFAAMPLAMPADTTKQLAWIALRMMQRREAMHLQRQSDVGLLVALYRHRYEGLGSVVLSRSEALYEAGLKAAIASYDQRPNPYVADLMADLAGLRNGQGRYVEAMSIIDSTLMRYGETAGGMRCYNLKQSILQKELGVSAMEVTPSGRRQLVCIESRNVEQAFFRIIRNVDYAGKYTEARQREVLLGQKVLEQWSQPIALKGDYKMQQTIAVVPALAQGDYLLLASSRADFKEEGISITLLTVRDWAFLPAVYSGSLQAGFLIDRVSGKPVAGQKVTLQYRKNYSDKNYVDVETRVTDNEGFFDFTSRVTKGLRNYYYFRVKAVCDGVEVTESMYGLHEAAKAERETLQRNIYFDRPIYKPGDTVQFELLSYASGRFEGHTNEGEPVELVVRDVNGKATDTLRLTTDGYGSATGRFVIAADALPGSWLLRSDKSNIYSSFRVEAYKQPKFAVTLKAPSEARSFGQPVTVGGVAASYSAVPVGNAQVTYKVTREEQCPTWRWGWWHWWHSENKRRVVASGRTTTDAQGLFEVTFTPWPDSNVELTRKPGFRYTVEATVTDLNGETHEAQTALAVGYENSYVHFGLEREGSEPVAFTVGCRNLDGQAIGGELRLEIARLQRPASPKLYHPVMASHKEADMPLTYAEFERLFPLYDYDGANDDEARWAVERKVHGATAQLTEQEPYRYDLKALKPGLYKVTAQVQTANGEEVSSEYYVECEPWTSKEPVHNMLETATVDKTRCEVGDTVRLKVGSRFDDVTFYILIHKEKMMNRRLLRRVTNGYVELPIVVNDTMLGGFAIEVAAVKENVSEHEMIEIEVPYSHKDLEVELETFRNKLEPGTQERWTLRVKEQKGGKPVAAHLLLTMYDHALDSYGSRDWRLHPWRQSYREEVFGDMTDMEFGYLHFRPTPAFKTVLEPSFAGCMLKSVAGYGGYYGRQMYRMSKNSVAGVTARGESGMVTDSKMLVVVEDDAAVENEIAEESFSVSAPESGQRLTSEDVALMDNGTMDEAEESGAEEFHLRQHLNTLALFRSLTTDAESGRAELSFTAPDLLTEWSLRGLAWSREMKVGRLATSVITQKRLMVVPNVPRFLRQGDSCLFSVKVSNLSGREQEVAVTLEMEDAADGAKLQMIVGDAVQHLCLADGASGEVRFRLAVPEAAVFVANYRVVARGEGCSDGEQAAIPLLPSRQLVTEAMAFYINGKGEKECEMQHLSHLHDGDTAAMTLRHYGLTVDVTPNPLWLALQSLPYVSRKENPSNIYLVNSYYANSLSLHIVQHQPMVERLFETWRQQEPDAFASALDRNSDLKQTVMEETPWLRDALAEEQRHREVARFFEPLPLERQLKKDMDKLLEAQRGDGGWSWIADGRWSSLYTTQYVLKTLGLLQQQGVSLDRRTGKALDRALNYVDKETYDYYKKYVKGSEFEPVNLDYLYVRSYYAEQPAKPYREAYDFFYNNAKKRNKEFRTLFAQAELALVFQRHGDTKLAREMAVRIREKALESDEMGMYWRDNTGSWCWNERPIETQALLIRVFDEVLGDAESVAKMQQWLLKQKQTTNWNSDVATVNAIQALLLDGKRDKASAVASPARMEASQLSVAFGSHELKTDTARLQLHMSRRLEGDEIKPEDGRVTIRKADDGIAWGALYWQYFEDVDKVPSSSMGVTLKRTLYRVQADGTLSEVTAARPLQVGEKVRVRLEVATDRNLEFLELKEPRCAAFEPVNTQSGWRWGNGLSYYRSVTQTAQTLYIDRLEKGKYLVESDYFVNNAGTYRTAPTVMQCLYAPEFRAMLAMPLLHVER